MKKVEIPGGTADVREADDLTPRQKRILRDAAMAAAPAVAKLGVTEDGDQVRIEGTARVEEGILSKTDWRRLRELREAAVIAQLAGWSLSDPLPTEDTIGDLDTTFYDALMEAIGAPPMGDTDFGPNPDPGSPTKGSADSVGPSVDAVPTPWTPESPTAGAASSTASSSPA